MNIVVTLPKWLIDAICDGRKTIVMRKMYPMLMVIGREGFYCMQKGTRIIRCWCRVDEIERIEASYEVVARYADRIFLPNNCIHDYMSNGRPVYLWFIGPVKEFFGQDVTCDLLGVDRAPQQFTYTQKSIEVLLRKLR